MKLRLIALLALLLLLIATASAACLPEEVFVVGRHVPVFHVEHVLKAELLDVVE